MKIGKANACLKQMEVALDTAQLGKQNAETEAALAKEKAEALKLEIKQTELMVSSSLLTYVLFVTFMLIFYCCFFFVGGGVGDGAHQNLESYLVSNCK